MSFPLPFPFGATGGPCRTKNASSDFEYLSIGKAEGLWLIVDLELAACQTGQNTGFSREQEKNEEFEERVKQLGNCWQNRECL